MIPGLRCHIFNRTPRVLQVRIGPKEPRRHYERPGGKDPGWLEVPVERAEGHSCRVWQVLSLLESRRCPEQLIDSADDCDREAGEWPGEFLQHLVAQDGCGNSLDQFEKSCG